MDPWLSPDGATAVMCRAALATHFVGTRRRCCGRRQSVGRTRLGVGNVLRRAPRISTRSDWSWRGAQPPSCRRWQPSSPEATTGGVSSLQSAVQQGPHTRKLLDGPVTRRSHSEGLAVLQGVQQRRGRRQKQHQQMASWGGSSAMVLGAGVSQR